MMELSEEYVESVRCLQWRMSQCMKVLEKCDENAGGIRWRMSEWMEVS